MCTTRILVCGGRDADIDSSVVDSCISEIISDYDHTDIEFVSGGAKGGDKLGENFAISYGYPIIQFLLDWHKYGKAAGPIRNKDMIEYINECADPIVIAFWDGCSKGTRNTIRLAQNNNIPVYIKQY